MRRQVRPEQLVEPPNLAGCPGEQGDLVSARTIAAQAIEDPIGGSPR